jgi:DNA-binding response OmpR family regulator
VQLTRKEFDLLTLLLEKKGRVLGVPYLLETVWGYDMANYDNPHTVETHVSSLRKKLGTKLGARIHSVTGHGYKFE